MNDGEASSSKDHRSVSSPHFSLRSGTSKGTVRERVECILAVTGDEGDSYYSLSSSSSFSSSSNSSSASSASRSTSFSSARTECSANSNDVDQVDQPALPEDESVHEENDVAETKMLATLPTETTKECAPTEIETTDIPFGAPSEDSLVVSPKEDRRNLWSLVMVSFLILLGGTVLFLVLRNGGFRRDER